MEMAEGHSFPQRHFIGEDKPAQNPAVKQR
jgi:hypothetical protein